MGRKYTILFLLCVLLSSFSLAQTPQEIMRKVQQGKQPTQKELEILQKYADSEAAKYKGMSEDRLHALERKMEEQAEKISGSGLKGDCPKPIAKLPVITSLSKEDYLTLCRSLMKRYGVKSGLDLAKFDAGFASAKSTDAGDLSAVLLTMGAGSAAIYSGALGATKAPGDFFTACNLGAALSGMGEFVPALQVLQYAESLQPGVAQTAVNKGWTYYEMGAFVKAEEVFAKVLLLDKNSSSACLGLAMTAECRGNQAKAAVYYRKADDLRRTPLSFAGVRRTSKKNAGTGNKSDAGTDAGDDSDSSLTTADLPKERKMPFDVYISDMQLPSDIASCPPEAVLEMKFQKEQQDLLTVTERYRLAIERIRGRAEKLKQRAVATNTWIVERDYDDDNLMLEDIFRILWGDNSDFEKVRRRVDDEMQLWLDEQGRFGAEYQRLFEQLARTTDEHARKALEYKICLAMQRHYKQMYAIEYSRANRLSKALGKAARDYYAFTTPIIERRYEPYENELLNSYRQWYVSRMQSEVNRLAASAMSYSLQYKTLECIPPPPPPPVVAAKETRQADSKAENCPLGKGIGGGLGPVSVKLTCSTFEVSAAMGAMASIKHDFKKHETRTFIGAGVKSEFKGTSAEASGGIEMVSSGGSISDIGVKINVKGAIGPVSTGIEGRFMVESGPSVNMEDLSVGLPVGKSGNITLDF